MPIFSSGPATVPVEFTSLLQSQMLMEYALDGTIITASSAYLKLLGYTLAELQGRSCTLLLPPEQRGLRTDLSQTDSAWLEGRKISKNGDSVWLLTSRTILRDRKGRAVKAIELAVDITDSKRKYQEMAGEIAAVSRSAAVIAFNMDGTIITANDGFLSAMGYGLAEIEGKHHSMFVEPDERNGADYREFWAALNRGEFRSGEFKRKGKKGNDVWILASYNPILDEQGRPYRVFKSAKDITEDKLQRADLSAQIEAIGKSQAVIQFDMDGVVLDANEIFLRALGYSSAEILGRHHSMFLSSDQSGSPEYREFWNALRRGEYQSGEYKRVGRGGREVWIQASYNPILDLDGRPFKVVKYAADTTEQVISRLRSERVRGLMESVAAGAEQLNASVREISEAMVKSRETAVTAVEKVTAATQQAQHLDSAAQSMSGIVEIINNITGQINLLALNATIESARAGEAGRGFAVVASEVKSLASQAKQATDKIASEIGGLNRVAGEVVGGLVAIRSAIQAVSEYVTSTAAAVEEQSVVTNEMSSGMQKAAAEAASIGAA
jgi:methyl-accepting chemotaxis protein